MNPKENLKYKHFYTFTCEGWKVKYDKKDVFLFLELIELTLNEFPDENDEVLIIIKDFLKSLYSLFWNQSNIDYFIKAAVYVEEHAEKLENKIKGKIKGFIDFTQIEDKKIKKLNKLRIYLRILESFFWNIIEEIPDKAEFLIVPHFFNVASKYVFYYIINKMEKLPEYSSKDVLGKFRDLNINEHLFVQYKNIYKGKLSEYISKMKNEEV